MKPAAVASHRCLLYGLFALFETLLVSAFVVFWLVDRRALAPISDAAGVAWLLSSAGLLIIGWLLRRGAPRLASLCLLSALAGFIGAMLLPTL